MAYWQIVIVTFSNIYDDMRVRFPTQVSFFYWQQLPSVPPSQCSRFKHPLCKLLMLSCLPKNGIAKCLIELGTFLALFPQILVKAGSINYFFQYAKTNMLFLTLFFLQRTEQSGVMCVSYFWILLLVTLTFPPYPNSYQTKQLRANKSLGHFWRWKCAKFFGGKSFLSILMWEEGNLD